MEAGSLTSGRPTGVIRRLATETKQAFKTTEFWAYVLAVVAILIAGTVDDSEGSEFGADKVWLYITLLTVGYMLARGFAKSGSRDPYWNDPNAEASGGSVTDRVRTAAKVLTDGEEAVGSTTPQGGGTGTAGTGTGGTDYSH